MKSIRFANLLLAACGLLAVAAPSVRACPFCSATAQTLSEELGAAEVAVIAELIGASKQPEDSASVADAALDSGMATFRVVEVLQGEVSKKQLGEIKIVYFGDKDEGKRFFTTGIRVAVQGNDDQNQPKFDWMTPFPLSEKAQQYVRQLKEVPETGADRIAFFQQYFENEDTLLAQDAYEEFARAPYADIVDLSPRMEREKLTHWIEDPQVGTSHRRLYLTMLGVCGQAEDIQKLEALLRYDYLQIEPAVAAMFSLASLGGSSLGVPLVDELVKADERRQKQCLDALIASYLRLTGPAGLPLIEERFLTNPNVTYPHLYSTIMALRFHGEECDVIPRDRLLQTVRLLLDNEEFADQVILDLARWEDWSVLDRLVGMFKNSKEESWIRQPVITYVLAAIDQPGEVGARAEKAMKELEAIDPKLVEQSRSYLAVAFLARGKFPATKTTDQEDSTQEEPKAADNLPETTPPPLDPPSQTEALEAEVPVTEPLASSPSAEQQQEKVSPSDATQFQPPSSWMIIGVSLVAALVLMGIFSVLLRGVDSHSADSRTPEEPSRPQ